MSTPKSPALCTVSNCGSLCELAATTRSSSNEGLAIPKTCANSSQTKSQHRRGEACNVPCLAKKLFKNVPAARENYQLSSLERHWICQLYFKAGSMLMSSWPTKIPDAMFLICNFLLFLFVKREKWGHLGGVDEWRRV